MCYKLGGDTEEACIFLEVTKEGVTEYKAWGIKCYKDTEKGKSTAE